MSKHQSIRMAAALIFLLTGLAVFQNCSRVEFGNESGSEEALKVPGLQAEPEQPNDPEQPDNPGVPTHPTPPPSGSTSTTVKPSCIGIDMSIGGSCASSLQQLKNISSTYSPVSGSGSINGTRSCINSPQGIYSSLSATILHADVKEVGSVRGNQTTVRAETIGSVNSTGAYILAQNVTSIHGTRVKCAITGSLGSVNGTDITCLAHQILGSASGTSGCLGADYIAELNISNFTSVDGVYPAFQNRGTIKVLKIDRRVPDQMENMDVETVYFRSSSFSISEVKSLLTNRFRTCTFQKVYLGSQDITTLL